MELCAELEDGKLDKCMVVMCVIYLKIIIYVIGKWNLTNYYLKKIK